MHYALLLPIGSRSVFSSTMLVRNPLDLLIITSFITLFAHTRHRQTLIAPA